jgi:maleylacetate reductase
LILSGSTEAVQPFLFSALPSRVRFGSGAISTLDGELAHLGVERAFLVATASHARLAKELAANHRRIVALFPQARMHTPTDITQAALARVSATEADGLIALGGGSSIGLSKALAYRTDLPQLAIPTTYAGSEATPILGETTQGLKTTVRDARVLPETIIYDPDLTLTLPVGISMTSGLNAIAHAAEALYAQDANPVVSLLAEEAIRVLARALPLIRKDPADCEARALALYGAWICGTCLGSVGMSLHHKLCHTLGGAFDIPHAETHAVLLAHAIAYNEQAAPEAAQRIARALKSDDAASSALYQFARELGCPMSLREIGMPLEGLERAADLATANPYANPRSIERHAIRSLLDNAFHGRPPSNA